LLKPHIFSCTASDLRNEVTDWSFGNITYLHCFPDQDRAAALPDSDSRPLFLSTCSAPSAATLLPEPASAATATFYDEDAVED